MESTLRRGALTMSAVALSVGLAGCGGSAPAAAPSSPTSPPKATPTPSTYYGETASVIASMIPGCTDVQVGDLGNGAVTGLSSTASCSLKGREVDVNSWTTESELDGVYRTLDMDKMEAYYARGTGWTVTTHDRGTLQMQLTNDASGLLTQAVNDANSPGSSPTTPPDLEGQRVAAEAVVKALGGEVVHVTP